MLAFVVQTVLAHSAAQSRVIDATVSAIEQTGRHLSLTFDKAESIGLVLSSNDNLLELANYDRSLRSSVYDELQLINVVTREIMFLAELNADVHTIYVYIDGKRQLITSAPRYYGPAYFPDTEWVDIAARVTEPFEWVTNYHDAGLSGRVYVSVICRADILRTEIRPTAYVSVNLDSGYIYRAIQGLRVTRGSTVFLLDGNGRIVAAANPDMLGSSIDDHYAGALAARKGGVGRVRVDVRHLAIYEPINVEEWGILTIVPERELFAAQRRAFLWPLSAIVLIAIALFFSASRLVRRSVTQPMEALVAAMQRAERGEFDSPIEEDRADEFGYLYHTYNTMVSRISQLIRELYQERILKQEMELQYLQTQVNPHFLYNTLDTINWLAKKYEALDISRIVMALSQLYRTAFNRGRDYIRVRDVLEGVRSYLYIEQFRYGSVRDYRLDVDDPANDCMILNLVLQPLVENAVVHGVGEGDPGGDVAIRAIYDPPLLRFRVADTGCGISSDKLRIIRRSMNGKGGGAASGLRNVNRRLQLFYGQEHGLQIDSEAGRGTVVSFAVPIRTEP